MCLIDLHDHPARPPINGRVLLPLALGLLALLSACGPVTVGGAGEAGGAVRATATMAAQAGSTAVNGCPVKQAPADAAAFVPDVTVTEEGGLGQQITLARGQRLEIRLGPEVQWTLTVTDPTRILASTTAEGWYSPQLNVCIWRFSALTAGSAQLTFAGRFICQPHTQCVTAVIAQEYDVTVR